MKVEDVRHYGEATNDFLVAVLSLHKLQIEARENAVLREALATAFSVVVIDYLEAVMGGAKRRHRARTQHVQTARYHFDRYKTRSDPPLSTSISSATTHRVLSVSSSYSSPSERRR